MRLGTDELRFMQLFNGITGVAPLDCVIEDDVIIFVTKPEEVPRAIGKRGKNVKEVERVLGKKVEVVGQHTDPVKLVKDVIPNAIGARLIERGGKRIVEVRVNGSRPSTRKVRTLRLLGRRYKLFDAVVINSGKG